MLSLRIFHLTFSSLSHQTPLSLFIGVIEIVNALNDIADGFLFLAKELEMIGFARPFLNEADFPNRFLENADSRVSDAVFNFKIHQMRDFAEAGFYDYQIHQLAGGKDLKPGYNPYLAVLRMTKNELVKGWF